MTRPAEAWKEWLGILLLLGFVVAFIVLVIGLAVALCRGEPPLTTGSPSGIVHPHSTQNLFLERTDP